MNRRAALSLAAVLLVPAAASADFHSLVRVMDAQPGLHRVWTPGISFVRMAVWMIHPEGVHDLQLAVYEGDARLDGTDLERILHTSRDRPMIRVHSNRTGETAVIWARPAAGGLIEMTLVAHDPGDDTVVLRAVIDAETLAREISDPRHASEIARR